MTIVFQTRTGFLTAILLLLVVFHSSTHAATYNATTETFSWIDPASHTNVVWTAAPGGPANQCSGFSINTDDDISQALPLGFNFNFGSSSYSSVRIMSNGRLQFNNTYCGHGTAVTGPPRRYPFPLPDTRLNNVMRIYGADLDPSAGGSVRYATGGSTPNRYFVATWTNVREWGLNSSRINLQVVLYESGDFVYQFGTISNPSQGSAQMGWHLSNNDYQLYEYGNILSMQNRALRFSGYTPNPISYYAMDELTWNGTAGEIRDTSGNNNHASRVGASQTVDPGYICRGGYIPGNNDGINTNLDVNSSIGNRGTISFWYNSDASWNSGNNMLADASNNLGNGFADKYFFLVKRTQGRLRFRLEADNDADLQAETPNNNFGANTWHHITITWDLVTDADWLQVYVDGVRRATSRGNRNSPLNVSNILGSLNTLYLGDNRTTGVGGNAYTNSSARGTMDEARIYTDVLSQAQIINDMNATHGCLLASWYMDQTSWNGSSGEVTDYSGNNLHGTGINNVNTSIANPAIAGSPGTCFYGSFDAADDYVALPGFPNLTDSFTITAWINPNVTNTPQRIFIDDESNSNGYGFSLSDGGSGRLRFYSRNINPVVHDSPVVISPGNWYHVAAVHDANARTRQIFVNGVAVTSAQTYTGTWGTDTGMASIGGETNNAGSEANMFVFNGNIDEVRVYSRPLSSGDITTVMNETRTCPVSLDHLRIEHDGTALTCEPESVTVRACLNASCSSEYSGDVAITLTPSGWTGGDNQTVTGGSSSFVLPRRIAGPVTLGINTPSPNPANGVQCLNTSSNANDCSLTFYDTGFIYSIPTQTSCQTSSGILISAVRLDNTSQACVPTFVGQTRNIDFSLNYTLPNTGTRDLALTYNSTNYTPINNTTSQMVPISFDSNGQATFSVTYPDAGQITLNSLYTGSVSTGDNGLSMAGAATFLNKPAKLYVFADEANSDCAGSSASCTAFKRAAEPFNLKVRAACTDNSVTPNFQLNGLGISHTNTAPAIIQGTLGTPSFNVSATDNGEHTISQTVSEVGAYTFTASLPPTGYYGESIGDTTLNTSVPIGRYYPDHFCLSANTIANRTDSNTASGCTDGFSYLDEEFSLNFTLTAQAMNAVCSDGSSTQNYSASWSKFNLPFNEDTTSANESGKWNFGAINAPSGSATILNPRVSLNTAASSPSSFTNGQANITTRLNINRSGSSPGYTAEVPFTDVRLGINPIDSDNVRIDSTDLTIGSDNYREIASTALYFGRLFSENAFGTNQTDLGLDMFARTEYCNAVTSGACTSWLSNISDSCTIYNISPPADTALGRLLANDGLGYYQRASATVSSSVFDFDDDGAAPSYSRVHVPDTNGNSAGWRLFYTAGGDGGDYLIPFTFPFNADPAVHPYLLHVDGIASFGQFRGDDRIIYWREILQ